MNAEDRQAIREKHKRIEMPEPFYGGCAVCLCYTFDETPELINAPWPCDVINVLDASENTSISCDTKQDEIRNECNHLEGGEIPHDTEGIVVWLYFIYCPKCGEKL